MTRHFSMMVCAAFIVMGATGCGGGASTAPGGSSSAPAPAVKVAIKNFAFVPATLTVPIGTTVTWTNEDSVAHTTTADKPGAVTWDSGTLSQAKSYSVKFTAAGTYSFHCNFHNYMTGTITVTG